MADMLDCRCNSMWQYGRSELSKISIRDVFAGRSLSLVKDPFRYRVFFAMFEYVKAQSFYAFVRRYYGTLQSSNDSRAQYVTSSHSSEIPTIKPHWFIEPTILISAGIAAVSMTQQFVQHPMELVQEMYYARLEALVKQARLLHTGSGILRQ